MAGCRTDVAVVANLWVADPDEGGSGAVANRKRKRRRLIARTPAALLCEPLASHGFSHYPRRSAGSFRLTLRTHNRRFGGVSAKRLATY